MGQDLLTYFPDAEINVVDSISTGGDIQIYIGTDSTNVPAGSDSTTDTEDETVTDSSLDDESDSTDSTNSTDVGTLMTRQLLADMTLVLTLSSKE